MESASLQLVLQVLMGVSLAACAGFRAFVPLLAMGVAGRMEVIPLAESFDWLSSWPALLVLGTAVAVEMLADKVPVVDHGLDLVATAVRPVAGAIVVASPLTSVDPMVATLVGLIVGGGVAGSVHVAKSQTRLMSTATTAGLGNAVLSLAEDVAAIVGSVLAVVVPLLAVLVIGAVALLLTWRFLRRRARRRQAPMVT